MAAGFCITLGVRLHGGQVYLEVAMLWSCGEGAACLVRLRGVQPYVPRFTEPAHTAAGVRRTPMEAAVHMMAYAPLSA